MPKTIVVFLYVVLTVIGLVPIGIVVVVFGFLGLRRQMMLLMYRVAQAWAEALIRLIGCRITVEGRENVPREGGLCFVSNHASLFDIVMLLRYAGRPIGFIAKKELALIPLLNMWILVIGGLFIDRKNPRKALATIDAGIGRIRAGNCMIVFPEGSRSKGLGLLPFRPGAFKLATQSGAAIVPVALAGTYDVFERQGRARACPVRITFCKPISVADIPPADRKTVLAEKVRQAISDSLAVPLGR